MAKLASRFAAHSPMLRSDTPLSDEQIARVAPSIFATEQHSSRSERYQYIPTSEVLNGLRREGFQPFMVAQTRVRNADHREYTKHMLRLRHAGDIMADGEANEIIVLNSHNGTSSYQILAGMFRSVCLNSMVCGELNYDIRIRHKGDVRDNVIEGAFTVLDSFSRIAESKAEMKALELSRPEAEAFANAALVAKYGEADAIPLTPSTVLTPRRYEDAERNLWATFNRVQENLIMGGQRGVGSNGRPRQTRAVSGIDGSVKLNKALWTLAESMRQLKAVA